MTDDGPVAVSATGGGRAAELGHAFDQAFAEPVRAERETAVDLLCLRVGAADVAVRLSEIRALLPEPKIVALPGATPGLLGIAGLRGAIVPIYSLCTLLGQAPNGEPLRWIILVGRAAPVGLAFEEFVGYLRAPASAILAPDAGAATAVHLRETAHIDGALRGIIDLPSVLRTLEKRVGAVGTIKET